MNLLSLRESAGETQDFVAEKVGIKKTTYWSYETGRTQPDFETLIKLADHFDCSIDYLLGHKTKNILHLDSFTPEQQELLDTVLQLTPTNCARVKAYADGLMTADEERETTIRKFRR